jgi:hypothetical protein
MDDFEHEVFQMGHCARVLSDAAQDEMVKRLLLEASQCLALPSTARTATSQQHPHS